MRESWLELVDAVDRPARAPSAECLRERERFREERRRAGDARARRIADCVARIEAARAEVFAAGDGVVPLRMTELEREWRALARPDPDAGLMDLWARIAPPAWIDHKRWRDAEPAQRLDVAVALAADAAGVEAAEAALGALAETLAPFGVAAGARVRWRVFERDFEGTPELLARPLAAALEDLASRDGGARALERARELERAVLVAARARFPERDALARAMACAALLDWVWRASSLRAWGNPAAPLRALWRTGYVLAALDETHATLAARTT